MFVVALLTSSLSLAADVSVSEFLGHCQAAPEPCKEKVLAYVKFLADGELINRCILQLPAAEVATKLVGYMHDLCLPKTSSAGFAVEKRIGS